MGYPHPAYTNHIEYLSALVLKKGRESDKDTTERITYLANEYKAIRTEGKTPGTDQAYVHPSLLLSALFFITVNNNGGNLDTNGFTDLLILSNSVQSALAYYIYHSGRANKFMSIFQPVLATIVLFAPTIPNNLPIQLSLIVSNLCILLIQNLQVLSVSYCLEPIFGQNTTLSIICMSFADYFFQTGWLKMLLGSNIKFSKDMGVDYLYLTANVIVGLSLILAGYLYRQGLWKSQYYDFGYTRMNKKCFI